MSLDSAKSMFCTCPLRDGVAANNYASSIFGECIYNIPETCSLIFGYISFFIWCVAMLPAIRMAFKLRDAGTLSAALLIIWIGGDALNLVSAVLTNQLQSQIAIAVFWLVSDLLCILQMIYYNMKKRSVYKKLGLPLPPIIPPITRKKKAEELPAEQENETNITNSGTNPNESSNISNSRVIEANEAQALIPNQGENQNNKKKSPGKSNNSFDDSNIGMEATESDGNPLNEYLNNYYVDGYYYDDYYNYYSNDDEVLSENNDQKPLEPIKAEAGPVAELTEENYVQTYEELILSLDENEEIRKRIVEAMKKHNAMDLNLLDIETREHYVSTRSKYSMGEIFIYLLVVAIVIVNLIWVGFSGDIAISLKIEGLKECPVPKEPEKTANIIGQVIAYTLPFIYSLSRVTQIIQNVKTKQVAGLSIGLFFLACTGDLTQIIAMVVHQFDKAYQIGKIPFVLGCLIPAILDVFIMCQYAYYTKKSKALALAEAQEEAREKEEGEESVSQEALIGKHLAAGELISSKKSDNNVSESETFSLRTDVNANLFKAATSGKQQRNMTQSGGHKKVTPSPINTKTSMDARKQSPANVNKSRPSSVTLTPVFFGRSKSFSVFTSSMLLVSETTPIIKPTIDKKKLPPLTKESETLLQTITRENIPSINDLPISTGDPYHVTPLHVNAISDNIIRLRSASRRAASVEAAVVSPSGNRPASSEAGPLAARAGSKLASSTSTTAKYAHLSSRSHSLKNQTNEVVQTHRHQGSSSRRSVDVKNATESRQQHINGVPTRTKTSIIVHQRSHSSKHSHIEGRKSHEGARAIAEGNTNKILGNAQETIEINVSPANRM